MFVQKMIAKQPAERSTLAQLRNEIDEFCMWELGSVRKWQMINFNFLDPQCTAIHENHVKHKHMPFGLEMPTATEMFKEIAADSHNNDSHLAEVSKGL